ncbi:Por secretion system C-terminal sorting domain-containing protein [Hymenobacter daecheongensis DSM 21074]|uniref:Por secretion system C-terminal sorting domain-containing protein n=1 Tax=Hymenobacter daecheongensis DSM 21074 TaxID=1121955 RepID=A0A1M6HJ65_9BACT|nr:S8 family serine peptidase [Hymenobacter daecheongensis]SHJ22218.1 Por secretion system C-terminal sorting domain-containing protein [Hymenobacter daecheongensis DSM 21074]
MRFSQLLLLAGLWAGSAPVQAAAAPPAARPPQTTGTVRKHLIYFTNKANSPYSLSQPQAYLSARALQRRTRQGISLRPRDLPVNPAYVAQVKAVAGVQLWYTSRWFNAAIVACDSTTLAVLNGLSCVRGAETLNRGLAAPRPAEDVPPAVAQRLSSSADYGIAYGQAKMIGAATMHNAGFRGEGMQIAVFDAGFTGVNQVAAFAPLFQEQRIASTFNFVDKNTSVYQRDAHGTQCLSTMAANQPGVFIGTAPKATYRLFITEDSRLNSENPIEEANWLVAAEYADSAGVDVISSSLGYTTFDLPSADYTYADMNGRTAISTRAAVVAARVGMLVVNSAGNEGTSSWRYIAAPADADSILTVGAVDSLRAHAPFSSYGPTADGRIKPNVATQGRQSAIISPSGTVGTGNGTSFSCPIMAGMAAGFWQANPALNAQQVLSFLQRSGTLATAPNNTLGYGIPHFVRAYNLANPNNPLAADSPAVADAALTIYPNPSAGEAMSLHLSAAFRAAPLHVRLFDARGRLVRELRLAATPAADVRLPAIGLVKGLYFCEVSTDKARQTVRFVQL